VTIFHPKGGLLLQLVVVGLACVAPESALSGPPPTPDAPPPADTGEPIEVLRPYLAPPTGRPWPATAAGDGPTDGDQLYRDGALQTLQLTVSDDALGSLRVTPTAEVDARLRWRHDDLRVALRLKGSSSIVSTRL